MEEFKLPKDELERIRKQIFSLEEQLDLFRVHMRGRDYRKHFNKKQRKQIKGQKKIYIKALNASIRCLIRNEAMDSQIRHLALSSRYVNIITKFKVLKDERDRKHR